MHVITPQKLWKLIRTKKNATQRDTWDQVYQRLNRSCQHSSRMKSSLRRSPGSSVKASSSSALSGFCKFSPTSWTSCYFEDLSFLFLPRGLIKGCKSTESWSGQLNRRIDQLEEKNSYFTSLLRTLRSLRGLTSLPQRCKGSHIQDVD